MGQFPNKTVSFLGFFSRIYVFFASGASAGGSTLTNSHIQVSFHLYTFSYTVVDFLGLFPQIIVSFWGLFHVYRSCLQVEQVLAGVLVKHLLLFEEQNSGVCIMYICATATHCNTLQDTATHLVLLKKRILGCVYICVPLQHTATHCNMLQHTCMCATATHCNTLQHTATHCNTLQHTATQHTGTHCNTLQHTYHE